MLLPKYEASLSVTQRWKRRNGNTDRIAMSTFYALCDKAYFQARGITLYLFPKFKGTNQFDLNVPLWRRDPKHNPREEDQSKVTMSADLGSDGLSYDSRAIPAFRECFESDDFLIGTIDFSAYEPFIYGHCYSCCYCCYSYCSATSTTRFHRRVCNID